MRFHSCNAHRLQPNCLLTILIAGEILCEFLTHESLVITLSIDVTYCKTK
jgi:hypothetical protein